MTDDKWDRNTFNFLLVRLKELGVGELEWKRVLKDCKKKVDEAKAELYAIDTEREKCIREVQELMMRNDFLVGVGERGNDDG